MSIFKALSIAGSDSGGGAGIQADLKTFHQFGVYGMTVITAVTAQNTLGVDGVYPMNAEAVERQLDSIGNDLNTDALKTGMLFDTDIIEAVARKIQQYKWENVVVDPVMVAKGGAELLQQEAVLAVKKRLLPLAKIVTPNIPEAQVLTGMNISSRQHKKEAAKMIHSFGVQFVVIKGGHETGTDTACDLVYDGSAFMELEGRRILTNHTHGTGCTFSAAITAELAKGIPVLEAVDQAKRYIQAAIESSLGIGHGHGPTNHWALRDLYLERKLI